MRVDADVAVVGSGFAGSLTALALRSLGRTVALIERGRHPRFAIGESSTPLANLLLEELADRYAIPQIRLFSKWGTWQRSRPDVGGGLKRGFTFFFHKPDEPFGEDPDHDRQLMVAASPHDDIGDTHWYRPDFDHNLVREAEAAGAIYLDETAIDRVYFDGDGSTLEGTRRGQSVRIVAPFVVDATGPHGLLSRTMGLESRSLRWLPPTQGLYTHFENVTRWDELRPETAMPYPADDAAVHHVFPGGWIWMLRFNNGVTSAGAAFTVASGFSQTSRWDDLLQALPSVREQFAHARAVQPWIHSQQLAFRTTRVSGPGWALLPSAAGVIDPLLSTGFPLTLLGIGRLLEILEQTSPGSERQAALARYEAITLAELDATEQLIAALYSSMDDVPLFKRLTLLYFAAASFSEASRRLNRREQAPGFLLHAHPAFGRDLHTCVMIALAGPRGRARDALLEEIDRAIEPFDIAGLLDRSRRDWYPVLADDLVTNAAKLNATPAEIETLLERSGFRSLKAIAD
jgi:tetracycline 7-halogenase / FADH2 O2-dependent halogenase